jgi:hypothetical protein
VLLGRAQTVDEHDHRHRPVVGGAWLEQAGSVVPRGARRPVRRAGCPTRTPPAPAPAAACRRSRSAAAVPWRRRSLLTCGSGRPRTPQTPTNRPGSAGIRGRSALCSDLGWGRSSVREWPERLTV